MDKVYVHAARKSSAAAVLCRALRQGGVKARRLRGNLAPRFSWPIINYGDSRIVGHSSSLVLNEPGCVAKAIGKIDTIEELEKANIPTIRATRDKARASKWWQLQYGIFARRDGLSNGRGMRIWGDGDFPDGEFYSRYWPKTHEYRVHVFNGKVIDLTEKRAKHNANANRMVRSHDNGWIFAHHISLSDKMDLEKLHQLALDSVKALGLHFGAVDILASLTKDLPRRLSKAVVCEVNTGPGLENEETIKAYVKAIKET